MQYSVDGGLWSSVFAVPSEIVDKHLKLCGAVSLKVLLILLRQGGTADAEQLANMLNMPVPDILDALNHWVQLGVLRGSEPAAPPLSYQAEPALPPAVAATAACVVPQPTPAPVQAKPEPRGESGEQKVVKIARRMRLSTAEINQLAREDVNVGFLLQEGQAALKKPLSSQTTEMLVSLYSYYGMSPDLILMLVQYCVSEGKESVHFIERQAAIWMEKGIDTHEKAEREIVHSVRRRSIYGQVQSAFGISDRLLVTKEKRFIAKWFEEYKQDISLIKLAYERCIESIGKLSFDYINGILTKWHDKGIATTQQASQEGKPQQTAPKVSSAAGGKAASSYNMEELEHMITYGPLEK